MQVYDVSEAQWNVYQFGDSGEGSKFLEDYQGNPLREFTTPSVLVENDAVSVEVEPEFDPLVVSPIPPNKDVVVVPAIVGNEFVHNPIRWWRPRSIINTPRPLAHPITFELRDTYQVTPVMRKLLVQSSTLPALGWRADFMRDIFLLKNGVPYFRRNSLIS